MNPNETTNKGSNFQICLVLHLTYNLALIEGGRKSRSAAAAASSAIQQTSLHRRTGSDGPVRKVGKDR